MAVKASINFMRVFFNNSIFFSPGYYIVLNLIQIHAKHSNVFKWNVRLKKLDQQPLYNPPSYIKYSSYPSPLTGLRYNTFPSVSF